MHDSYLPTFWTISLPIIFKRTVYSLACLSVVLGSEIFEWVCLNGRVPPGTAHHPHGHIHAQVRLGRATTRLQQRSHSSTMRSGTTDGGLTTSSLLGQCSLCVLAPRLLLCLHAYIVPNHTYLRATHAKLSRARVASGGGTPDTSSRVHGDYCCGVSCLGLSLSSLADMHKWRLAESYAISPLSAVGAGVVL